MEATVNFVCWDIRQLEELELLYMRPNYSVLLEWGWAPYLTNEGKIGSTVDFNTTVLYGGATKEAIWNDLYNKSLNSGGNYQGLYGFVKNYSWSARPDGGYDCSTTLITMGELIESLKANWVPATTNIAFTQGIFNEADAENFKKDGPLNKAYQRSFLAGMLYEIYVIMKDKMKSKEKNAGLGCNFYCYEFKSEGQTPPTDTKGGDQPESFVSEPKNIYIKLKDFIALLNKYNTLYGGKEGSKTPIVEVSLTEGFQHAKPNEPLLCLGHPYQISMDPTVCLIKNKEFSTAITVTGAAAGGEEGGETSSEAGNTANEVISGMPDDAEFLKETPGGKYGIIERIYVNLAYLYTLITDDGLSSQDKNEKKDINLFDFLKNMMSGINTSIGNVANFDIHVDPTDSIARIIDVNYIDEKTQDDAYEKAFELQMHNLKSTVRSYKLESQIFPEQSSVVAIGAQAKGGALGQGDNTLIDFNQNLEDRIIPAKDISPFVQPSTTNDSAKLENLKTNLETIAEYFSSLDDGNQFTRFFGGGAEFDKAKASQYTNALKDIISYTRTLTKDPTNNRAIIPTKLSIEMDGIGGIIIGSMFKIPDELLPRGYKGGDVGARIGYLVTSVAHSIGSDQDWKTSLGAQFIILDKVSKSSSKLTSIADAISKVAKTVERVKKIQQAPPAPPIDPNTPTPPLNPSSKYKASITPQVKKNLDEIEKACIKYGLTDRFLIIALKANILKETGGSPINENINYSTTSVGRLKTFFGNRVASLVAGLADNTTLKAAGKWPGEVTFGDYLYGNLSGKTGVSFQNTAAGDGYKYRGRSYIGITGKSQYIKFGKKLNQDFVNNPDSMNTPTNAAETTVLFIKEGIPYLTKYYGGYFGYTISDTNPVFKTQSDANLFVTNIIGGIGLRLKRPINAGSPFVEILAKVDSYSTQVTTNV
jgi:predicted chitinase